VPKKSFESTVGSTFYYLDDEKSED